ncbi:MAG TPA: ribose-5-phosphate isomerase RpiA [Candidatus Eisenbacteria bacterium]|nr:ribose-5-phosphate isomerase RpiA [Candidatus Eisenbacteria bacterium]
MADRDELKLAAARRALELVAPGMVLGIGTGTTARFFIEGLAGLRVAAVPTSRASAELARASGVELLDDPRAPIDLAVDGADEIDPGLGLVKGHGGALFREKMVAAAATRFVVIADDSKLVDRLGRGAVPVEVAPFLWRHTAGRLAALGASWSLRGGESAPYRTDNGNLIVDLVFPGGLAAPRRTGAELKGVTGVLDHGLFLGLATGAVVAGPAGVEVLGSLD